MSGEGENLRCFLESRLRQLLHMRGENMIRKFPTVEIDPTHYPLCHNAYNNT